MVSDQDRVVEQIWVNITEATKITGYNRGHMSRLVRTIWNQPEETRPIKLRHRTSGYELWLPDLIEYMEKIARGPYLKESENK